MAAVDQRVDAGVLPPGPAFDPRLQAVLYHRYPLAFLLRARDRYGPVFTMRMAGKEPLVVVSDPEFVLPLLDADPKEAHAGDARRSILPQASPRSPFGADGAEHAAIRTLMAPAFRPERFAERDGQLRTLAAAHCAQWPRGRPFRLLPRMRTLATHLFVRTVLGVRGERVPEYITAIRRMLWTPGNPPLPVPAPADGALGRVVQRSFEHRRARAARLLEVDLRERREHAPAESDDLLTLIATQADVSLDVMVDQLLVVIAAAQEPPAIALTNVVLEVARHPESLVAFRDGDRAEQARIVNEVLRLRPSAQAALRRLSTPFIVNDRTLPAGANIALSSLLLHRDPTTFPEPGAFRPERRLDPAPPAYLPFGGGLRRCIGEFLARAELDTVLPTVLGSTDVSLVRGAEERMVVRGTVLVPQRSGFVTLRPA